MDHPDISPRRLKELKSQLSEKVGRKGPPIEVAQTYCELGRSIRARVSTHGVPAYRVIRECGITIEEMAHALMELAAYEQREQYRSGYQAGFAVAINRGLRRTG